MQTRPYVRQHDVCPARQCSAPIGIGRPSMAATDALEAVPCWSVLPIDAAADRTSLRRVFRIDRDQRNTSQCRFVGQKGPKLSERPTVVRPVLRPLNRCPLADVRQIFDGNPAAGVCGLPNDSLADPVVEVGRKARFLPAPGVQQSLRGFGPFPLQVAPKPGVAAPEAGVEGTAERLAITVGSDVPSSEVDAEILGRVAFWHIANLDGHVEKEHAVAIDQIGLTACPIKPGLLKGAAIHGMICLPSLVWIETRSAPFHDRMRWS